MNTKNLLEVPDPWPRKHRPWNVRLIPAKLEELAKAGIYYESKIINKTYEKENNKKDSEETNTGY